MPETNEITPTDGYRAALERELAGYEQQGKEDRAALVRAELARVATPVETVVDEPAIETADDQAVDEEPAAKAKRRRAAAADEV